MSEKQEPTALGHIRVLDLADEKGWYCGKLLADMGADTIKVEKPGGDDTRRLGPFYKDIPNRERSLTFWYYNTNKRGITLNLESSDGREIFKSLVKTAAVLVESYNPGYLEGLGLSYSTLREINPSLIHVAITGFGQDGPYKDYKAPDIVASALGGVMAICGLPDTPPLLPPGGQSYHIASTNAAIATLAALFSRGITGRGQYIDQALHEGVALTLEFTNLWYIYCNAVLGRSGSRHGVAGPVVGPEVIGNIYPAKDGYMNTFGGGPGPLLDWMKEEDMPVEELMGVDYKFDPEFGRRNEKQLAELKAAFVKEHNREELFHAAQKRGIQWSPVKTIAEAFQDPALRSRDFFVEVEHPEVGDRVEYAGAPWVFGESAWRIARRAPLIGEHNIEIYEGELGHSRSELALLASAGVI